MLDDAVCGLVCADHLLEPCSISPQISQSFHFLWKVSTLLSLLAGWGCITKGANRTEQQTSAGVWGKTTAEAAGARTASCIRGRGSWSIVVYLRTSSQFFSWPLMTSIHHLSAIQVCLSLSWYSVLPNEICSTLLPNYLFPLYNQSKPLWPNF